MNTYNAYNGAYSYNGLLFVPKKERSTGIPCNMDEPGKFATRKRPVTKDDSIYTIYVQMREI